MRRKRTAERPLRLLGIDVIKNDTIYEPEFVSQIEHEHYHVTLHDHIEERQGHLMACEDKLNVGDFDSVQVEIYGCCGKDYSQKIID